MRPGTVVAALAYSSVAAIAACSAMSNTDDATSPPDAASPTDGSLPPDGDDGGVLDADSGDAGSRDADGGYAGDAFVCCLEGGGGPPPPLVDFGHEIDVHYCERLLACCEETPSTFDVARCVTESDSLGGFVAIQKYEPFLDAGLVQYNGAYAVDCLTQIDSLQCGTMSSSAFAQIVAQCFSALNGTVVDGGACRSSIECTSGQYCAIVDAGGACSPTLAQGASCTTPNGDECDYLGNGAPSLNCAPSDAGTTGFACAPRAGLGVDCLAGEQCQSTVCGNQGLCSDQIVVSDPGVPGGTCAYFTIADAGGDE